jgi:hypothetical protein
VWTDATKTIKVREYQYQYTGGRLTTEINIQYEAGVEIERLTYTYTYTGVRLQAVTVVRSTP